MSDEMVLDGQHYISSKRAAEITGYAQDYIGQLARSGFIEARRVGGLWFISEASVIAHKNGETELKAESVTEEVEENAAPEKRAAGMDTFVTIDGKSYISANRASKLSGYNQDYVGQLARSGQILSRLVGKRWYVEQESLLTHKREKDALLAEVQSQSVGFEKKAPPKTEHIPESSSPAEDHMRYFSEERDLIPTISSAALEKGEKPLLPEEFEASSVQERAESTKIPIRVNATGVSGLSRAPNREDRVRVPDKTFTPQKSTKQSFYTGAMAMSALTIVVVISLGFAGIKGGSTYTNAANSAHVASVSVFAENLLTAIEDFLSPPLSYVRTD